MIRIKLLILLTVFFSLRIFSQETSGLLLSDQIAEIEGANYSEILNFTESPNSSNYDLIYQRMEWAVDPDVRYIEGEVTTYFKSETDNLDEIEFDLIDTMTIDSIIQDGLKINFTHADDKVTIHLNKTLQDQQMDSVQICYEGVPVSSDNGFGSFIQSTHQGVPVIWTLSEPYGAKEWWPCKQSLKDKIDSMDIIVSSPEQYRTASNGVLVSETISEGIRKMHWKHRYPIATYLVAIAVTNYVDYSDLLDLGDGRQINILNYVYPEDSVYATEKTPATVQIMDFYNDLIGEYPFSDEKYGHAQFGWSGGMEHQTMSFVNNFEFNLIAHELAHQWFGDYITLGSWHDIWLNEGFATYLAALAGREFQGETTWQNWKRSRVQYITGTPDGSVFVQDTTSVSRIFSNRLSYAKGAYLLHMLRWVLGDDNFFKGIRNYFNDSSVANGFASNDQFIEHMEEAGDTSLTEFFNDWYFGEGYPIYSANYTIISEGKYKIELSQTTSYESVNFFEMPVPVRVYNIDKTDSADFRLNQTENNQEFVINPEFYIGELKIDPEFWLLSKTDQIVYSPKVKYSDEILVFPNPVTDKLSFYIPPEITIDTIYLYSLNGVQLKQLGPNEPYCDLSDLDAGIYILQINTLEKSFVRQIIKR